MLKNKSLAAFFISCTFLTSVAFYVHTWNSWGPANEITWDISGYYMYLPGFFYDDLGELHNLPKIINEYHPSGDDFNAHRSALGKYVIKYSSGMAIQYLPGFAIGHIWAKLGGYPVDGFSPPYQKSMALYSLLISFIGLWFIRKVLLLYFGDTIVACALLVLCFATNYLNYSAITPMFSHNYLFTIYAILIYLSIGWYKRPDFTKAALIGLLAGLAALTRPTEAICALIPLMWGVGSFKAIQDRIKLFLNQWPKVLIFCFCALCIGSVQLFYWKAMTGHFIYWSYDQDQGFNFLKVPVYACLFSYKKGWFAYTPVMVLSVLGFVPLLLKRRALFWPIIIYTLIALYLAFSWSCWWYGGSFSFRAVIQYYALLIFPLAAFFEWIKYNWYIKNIIIIFCLLCTYLNIVMTYQANVSGVMESDNMSEKYYWAIFGRPTVPKERRKLIDTDEELPEHLKSNLKTIYRTDTLAINANFRDTIYQGKRFFILDKNQQSIPEASPVVMALSSGWFRIHCFVCLRQWADNQWQQPYIYAGLFDTNGKLIKFKSYLIQRILSNDSINEIFIDIKMPEGAKAKILKSGVNNNGTNKVMFAGPVWVEYEPSY